MIESVAFRYVIIVATLFVIFIDPIEVLAELPDPRDAALPFFFLILKLVVFLLFVLEMSILALVRGREYLTSFFFALDLITLVSFAPDFAALAGVNLFSSHSLKLAKAGKEARVSARVARLFALVRVEKIVKQSPHPVDALDAVISEEVAPNAAGGASPDPLDAANSSSFFALSPSASSSGYLPVGDDPSEANGQDSKLGAGSPNIRRRRFGESIIQSTTNKVTALVLVLFIASVLLQTPLQWQPHAQAGLNAVQGAWMQDPSVTRDDVIPLYLEPYQADIRAVSLIVNHTCVFGCDFDETTIRDEFIETVTTHVSIARFNVSHTVRIQALLSILLMLLVVVILGVGNAVICWDAYQLVELGDKLIETMKLLTDHVLGNSSFNPALEAGIAPGLSNANAMAPVSMDARRRAASLFDTIGDMMSEYSYDGDSSLVLIESDVDDHPYIDPETGTTALPSSSPSRLSRRRRKKARRAGLFDILDSMQNAAQDVAAHNRHVAHRLSVMAAENLRLHMEKRQLVAIISESGALKGEVGSSAIGQAAPGIGIMAADGREVSPWPRELVVQAVLNTEDTETLTGRVETVASGNIRGLLHHLFTSQDDFFVDTFLVCFRRYLSPVTLLEHLIVRFCRVAATQSFEPYDPSKVVAWWGVLRILHVLRRWLVLAHIDFVDIPDTVDLLHTLIRVLMPQLGMGTEAAEIESLLERNLSGARMHDLVVAGTPIQSVRTALDEGPSDDFASTSSSTLAATSAFASSLHSPVSRPPRPRVTTGPLTLGTADPIELARQLCLYESRLFRRIRPEELFDVAWKHPHARALAPNVLAFVDHFDATVRRVQVAILDAPSPAARASTLETLVWAAVALRDLSNANGLMEIVSALASNPIKRLAPAWDALSEGATEAFRTLRELLFDPKRGAGVRSLSPSSDTPDPLPTFIPYLGLYLQDLFKLDDGNPDWVGPNKDLINIRKGAFVASLVVGTLARWQTAQPYGFFEYKDLLAILTAPPTPDESKYADEEALYDRSLQVHPRSS